MCALSDHKPIAAHAYTYISHLMYTCVRSQTIAAHAYTYIARLMYTYVCSQTIAAGSETAGVLPRQLGDLCEVRG